MHDINIDAPVYLTAKVIEITGNTLHGTKETTIIPGH